MTNGHGQAKTIGHLGLQPCLPQPRPATIAAATIRDERGGVARRPEVWAGGVGLQGGLKYWGLVPVRVTNSCGGMVRSEVLCGKSHAHSDRLFPPGCAWRVAAVAWFKIGVFRVTVTDPQRSRIDREFFRVGSDLACCAFSCGRTA